MAALHRAVAFEEVHGLARGIREHLHLDVARPQHRLLEEHRGVAERAVGLAHGLFERGAKVVLRVDTAHAAPAAARDRLREDREPDLLGLPDELLDVARRRSGLQHGHAGGDRVLLRGDLVAGHLEHVLRRADERDTGLGGRLREFGVLREEAVARVDGVGARLLRDADDLRDIEVRTNGMPRLADLVRLVGLQPVQRVPVLERVDRDRLRADLDGGTERANGDLTAIGNQDLREHASLSDRNPHSERLGIARVVKVTYLFVHVLSVSSLKGGVGKTTVTLGLASAAFARGVRTLVVDLDPQSDVSTGMDIQVAGHLNVADVLASPKEKIVRSAIAPSGWTRSNPSSTIDVMIGSPSAINFDGPHPSIRDIWKLEEALANVEADYELVLIDCAPSLNALTRTAWAASDRVAVVTEPGLFSVAAADRALRAIEEIRRGLSPRLQPLGIIVNRARVQSLEHQFRIKELRDMFGPLVLSPQLPERTSLQQAQGAAKPLHMWPGESAEEMSANFDQLLERVLRTARIGEYANAAPLAIESHVI